jgi:hypothetical protein
MSPVFFRCFAAAIALLLAMPPAHAGDFKIYIGSPYVYAPGPYGYHYYGHGLTAYRLRPGFTLQYGPGVHYRKPYYHYGGYPYPYGYGYLPYTAYRYPHPQYYSGYRHGFHDGFHFGFYFHGPRHHMGPKK